MQIHAAPGKLTIHFGPRFDAPDAARAADALSAFRPLSALTLDFTDVREFHDAALAPLAAALGAAGGAGGAGGADVILRGLTRHQTRMLSYLGVRAPARGAEGSRPASSDW
jgi:hypothetical protein